MDIYEKSLKYHEELKGKIEIKSRCKIDGREALSLAYTPGVASACLDIEKNPSRAYDLTRKWNTVAVVSDGSAVLGLGNIGGLAGLPVMEGKAVLFKEFGGVDAVPIVLSGQDTEDVIKTVEMIAPSFGGINLEDIAAPRCFEIERRLKEKLDIPVFHDDQHGTAIVVLAAILNALKLAEKKLSDIKVTVCGAGSAGIAISRLLIQSGVKNLILVDRQGIVNKNESWLNNAQREMAEISNPYNLSGSLSVAVNKSDVFVGVSAANQLNGEMVKSMNEKSVIFAMANPKPEIMPEDALSAGAFIVGTGRSDYPNQINNVLAFPGIFKGALSVRSKEISEGMKVAAAYAISGLVSSSELKCDYILPNSFDERVGKAVSQAVANQAIKEKLNRI